MAMPRWVKVNYCPLEGEQFLTFWRLKREGFQGYLAPGQLLVHLVDKKGNLTRSIQFYSKDWLNENWRSLVKDLVPSKGTHATELLFSEDQQIREVVASLKWGS